MPDLTSRVQGRSFSSWNADRSRILRARRDAISDRRREIGPAAPRPLDQKIAACAGLASPIHWSTRRPMRILKSPSKMSFAPSRWPPHPRKHRSAANCPILGGHSVECQFPVRPTFIDFPLRSPDRFPPVPADGDVRFVDLIRRRAPTHCRRWPSARVWSAIAVTQTRHLSGTRLVMNEASLSPRQIGATFESTTTTALPSSKIQSAPFSPGPPPVCPISVTPRSSRNWKPKP